MATVDLINVSKNVGPTAILNKLNVSIRKGEFMVVVGPSGCGKSTLLRLIAGLDEVSSGQIKINNQCVNDIPAAKRDMAMVFQSYALYPHMSVFDNMAYGLKMRGIHKTEIYTKVSETAQLLKLTPYLERKPNALSGGQKQRVAMGRAIVRSPSVYLFDEPLSNLDAALRTEMRHEIKRLHQQFNTTSLYVTHDQTEAMTMAERVMVLNDGLVEQIGTPQELYLRPATLFVAGFTGHYPMNFVNATFAKSTHLIHTKWGVSLALPECVTGIDDGAQIVVAIRPEHIQVCCAKQPDALQLKIDFIDDMGADKLIQANTLTGEHKLTLRVSAETVVSTDSIYVRLPQEKIHLFEQHTGTRIGE